MNVVTSPQGRQRIVFHETKVIWIFTNYQFFEHFGLKRPSAANGPFSHARSHLVAASNWTMAENGSRHV